MTVGKFNLKLWYKTSNKKKYINNDTLLFDHLDYDVIGLIYTRLIQDLLIAYMSMKQKYS